ncbi:hypothetical protein RA19_13615 [Leisingera sp. ANG-M1]|nr:hypothetical protein RA19_13615 [Leisingera sp. ANG-M1]
MSGQSRAKNRGGDMGVRGNIVCLLAGLGVFALPKASFAQQERSIIERLECLEAQLQGYRDVSRQPYDIVETTLDRLPVLEEGTATRPLPGAVVTLDRTLARTQVIIGYSLTLQVASTQKKYSVNLNANVADKFTRHATASGGGMIAGPVILHHGTETRTVNGNGSVTISSFDQSYFVTQLLMNGEEIRQFRGIQGGRWQGLSPSGFLMLKAPDGDGPIEISLNYRTRMPLTVENDLVGSDWQNVHLFVAVPRTPVWPVEACGADPWN